MDTGLKGKTAIVTGAASGIGLATVRALALEGAHVVAADVDGDGLRRADLDPNGSRTVVGDVSLQADAERIVEAALELGGRVDVLVNDAGIGFSATLTGTSVEQWDRTMEVNVRGPFLMCRTVIPAMLRDSRGGVIVNVASAAGLASVANRAAYCTSKAAVIAMTRSITVDYGTRGIRANAVAPGVVDTPWVDRMLVDADEPAVVRRAMEDRQIVGRLGRPDEIADAIVYLASDRSTFMHGSTLVVDGGFSAR